MFCTYSYNMYNDKSDAVNGLVKKDKWKICKIPTVSETHSLVMSLYDNRLFSKRF